MIVHRRIDATAWLLGEENVLAEWTTCHRPPPTLRPARTRRRTIRRPHRARHRARGDDDPDPAAHRAGVFA